MNATEKIVQMPDRLNRLAEGIKADLANAAKSREAWTESMVAAAIKIAQARALNVNNIAFGEWWDAQRFGLGHQDRAALVAMGDKPDEMRKVFSETTRSSIQLIFAEHKGRFTSTSKTPDAARKPKPKPTPARKSAPGKAQPARERDDDEALPKTAQAKVDAAITRERKRLEREFEARVRAQSRENDEKMWKPYVNEKLELAEGIVKSREGVFKKPEYNAILKALDPGHVNSLGPETVLIHNEAMKIFLAHKAQLLREEDHNVVADPWSLDNLDDNVKADLKAKAERAARSKAAHAAK